MPALNIQTIIFDLSEVLIAGLVGIEKPLSTSLNLPAESIFSALGGMPLLQLFLGQLKEDEYLSILVKRNRWYISNDVLKKIIRENFKRTIPGMPQFLLALENQYELILLSDHAREWVADIQQVHDFLKVFYRQYYSFELGQTKSDPLTFQTVLDQVSRKADTCLFIDDSQQNVNTANSIGIRGIQFTTATELQQMLAGIGIALNGVATPKITLPLISGH